VSKDFDPHQFIQWCATHPHEKAPTHTIGDLLQMQKHAAECASCDELCRKALEDAPAEKPFSKN